MRLRRTSNRRFLLSDPRGSVVAVTDGAGAVTDVNKYDDYGAPASGNIGRFQFTGQMWLEEAGLYHYKARAYHPALGRFMQTDPIGYGDGMNMYAYVGNDPVNARDPSGMCSSRMGVMGSAMCQVICFNERDCGGGGERNNRERGGGGECKICNNAPPKPPFNMFPHHAGPQDMGRFASLGGWNDLSIAASFGPLQVVIDSRGARVFLNWVIGEIGERDVIRRLENDGWDITRYVWFRDPLTSRTSPIDIVARKGNSIVFVEVKTGGGKLTRNQESVIAAIQNGTAIPFGPNARNAGLQPGVSLCQQGICSVPFAELGV